MIVNCVQRGSSRVRQLVNKSELEVQSVADPRLK
jgi:hypothetical protein